MYRNQFFTRGVQRRKQPLSLGLLILATLTLATIGESQSSSDLQAAVDAARQMQNQARERYKLANQAWSKGSSGSSPASGGNEINNRRSEIQERIRQENADYEARASRLQRQISTESQPRPSKSPNKGSKIRQEIQQLLTDKEAAIRELRLGLFCSECHHTKTELERGGESFAAHLKRVHGHPVPATQEDIDKKAREYDEKIEQKQRELDDQTKEDKQEQQQRNDRVRELRNEESQLGVEHRQRIADLSRQLSDLDQEFNRSKAGDKSEKQALWAEVERASQAVTDADVMYVKAREKLFDANGNYLGRAEQAPLVNEFDGSPGLAGGAPGFEPSGPGIELPPPFEGAKGTLDASVPAPSAKPSRAWDGVAAGDGVQGSLFSPPSNAGLPEAPNPEASDGAERSSFLGRLGNRLSEFGESAKKAFAQARDATVDATKAYFEKGGKEMLSLNPTDFARELIAKNAREPASLGKLIGEHAGDTLVSHVDRMAEHIEKPFHAVDVILSPTTLLQKAQATWSVIGGEVTARMKSYASKFFLDKFYEYGDRLRGRPSSWLEREDFEFTISAPRLINHPSYSSDGVSDLTDRVGRWVQRGVSADPESLYVEQ